MSDEYEQVEIEAEQVYVAEQKANKNIALTLLGVITLVAVGAMGIALIYPLAFADTPEVESETLSSLATIATLGVGALAALLGGNGNGKP